MSFLGKLNVPQNEIDIVLIGELLVDRIIDEEAKKTEYYFGGSPANISVNLARLGISPRLFSSIGSDDYGKFLKSNLKEYGVSDKYLTTVEGKTTIVEINKTEDTPSPRFLRFSDYQIPLNDSLKESVMKTKFLHYSYWTLTREPSKSTVLQVINYAKHQGIIIGFDPNYHFDLTNEESVTLNQLKSIICLADIIKPSLDDSKRIFGDGYSIEEYLDMYISLGCQLVIMTLGKNGLIASYKGEIIRLPSYATKIVDATGAGDAFWAGLYSGMLNDLSIYDSIRIGLLASSYALKEVGAITSIPRISELIKLL